MKRLFLVVLLLPIITLAQYWGERSTEQSFEQSELYFNSNYLNPMGVLNYKDVSAGLFDDPFLNLYINPANLPELKNGDLKIYMDFRGDRTSPSVVDNYIIPMYYMDYRMPYIDPRWVSNTRTEPEPVVSLGLLTYPIKDITDKLFIGGTYQFIHKEEKFYTLPYHIYNSNYYYLFDGYARSAEYAPVKDRYSGKDEMINEGHLFSAFAGYKILDNLNVGISLNGVVHSREGGYLNSSSDEFGNTDRSDWANSYIQDRNQNYDHLDFSGGLLYKIKSLNIGIKAGMLTGNADQDYSSYNSYFYKYNEVNSTADWHYSISNSSTIQNWQQDGKTKYASVNIRIEKENKTISGYYRYTKSDIDISNSSEIFDTSYYTSRWIDTYSNVIYDYLGASVRRDKRSGTGKREVKKSEGMGTFKWQLTSFSSITVGVYGKNISSEAITNEPVNAAWFSQYSYTGNYPNNSLNTTNEIKELEWVYNTDYWSLQIPVLLDFKINDNFSIMLGLNRTLTGWEITNVTTAYFDLREKNENGTIKTERNFGERYTQPRERLTDNYTDFISKFDVSISPALKVSLLLDPEFQDQLRIAQWWLAFNAEL